MAYDNDGTGATSLLTFFFGIAVGVAGTLVYAALNEEQFRQTLGKTKKLTGNVRGSVEDYMDDANDKLKSVAGKAQSTYNKGLSKVKAKATQVADQIEDSAHEAKKEINS